MFVYEINWFLYCAFQKRVTFEVQKPTNVRFFCCRQSSLANLLGKGSLLQQVQKVMVCDWWILIHFVCFCVRRFVAVIVIRIGGSEKCICQGGFSTSEFLKSAVRS